MQKQWVDDEDAEHCTKCGTGWSFFNRRHHCRSCGRVFCDACSKGRCEVDGFKGPQRVCDTCHQRLSKKAEWEGPAAAMMKNGADILEYYRVFSPGKLNISLSDDTQTFVIKEASSGKVKDTFQVSEINSINPGCTTQILKSNKADSNCAVCLTAKGKDWNIAFQSQKVARAWVRGLKTRREFDNMETPEEMNRREQQAIAERNIERQRNEKRSQRNKMRQKYQIEKS